VIEKICIKFSLNNKECEKIFHEKPVKMLLLRYSPKDKQAAKEIHLLILLSQKNTGNKKLGITNSNINKGRPNNVTYLNASSSCLYSKADMIHEKPKR